MTVKLESKLSAEHLRALQETVKQSTTDTSERVSQTHAKKFSQLTNNEKAGPPVVDTTYHNAHWVRLKLQPSRKVSISPSLQRKLPSQKSYLRLKAAFSVSTSWQKTQYVFRLRTFLRIVPSTVNLTKEQENALQNLRKDETVKILPADKGRSIVVMDSDEYKEKVAVLLNDSKTYLKLTDKRLNPTTSVEKDLNKILLNIKSDNNGTAPQFGPNLYRKLHCGNSKPASFYGLPKIHKPGRLLRPITSSIGSPTYAVSKYLVSVLSPLRKNTFTVQNSSVFTQQIKQHSISSEEIMVSFDVKSVFFFVLFVCLFVCFYVYYLFITITKNETLIYAH